MKQFLLLVLVFIGFSSYTFSQTAEVKKEQVEISICRPEITESGRQAGFHFGYVYRVVTDEKGLIKELKELVDSKKYRGYMNDENVIPCIKKWKLKPSEKYIVTIDVGTTGDEFLVISNKKDKIKINL